MNALNIKNCLLGVAFVGLTSLGWANQTPTQFPYKNLKCDYQINIPATGSLNTNLAARDIVSLKNNDFMLGVLKEKLFDKFPMENSCAAHIVLPTKDKDFKHIHRLYLDVARLKNASKDMDIKDLTKLALGFYPPNQSVQTNPAPEEVTIAGKKLKKITLLTFKQKGERESLMYFYHKNDKYYVFSFVALGSNIASLSKKTQTHDKKQLQSYVESMLQGFKIVNKHDSLIMQSIHTLE